MAVPGTEGAVSLRWGNGGLVTAKESKAGKSFPRPSPCLSNMSRESQPGVLSFLEISLPFTTTPLDMHYLHPILQSGKRRPRELTHLV